MCIGSTAGGCGVGCGGSPGQFSSLIEPCIRKGNVRADKGIPSVYKCISRLDPNLSNPRVGGSNPPGRDAIFPNLSRTCSRIR